MFGTIAETLVESFFERSTARKFTQRATPDGDGVLNAFGRSESSARIATGCTGTRR